MKRALLHAAWLLALPVLGGTALAQSTSSGDVPLGPPPSHTSLPDLGSSADSVLTRADEYQIGRMMVRNLREENALFEDPETTEYLQSIGDIENVVVRATATGTPIRVADVGRVSVGPAVRRGIAELDGRGDAVGGIVVMRLGENALQTIHRVTARLARISGGLPPGGSVGTGGSFTAVTFTVTVAVSVTPPDVTV